MKKLPPPKHVPVMKGNPSAFTCLGNWYDLNDPDSMHSLHCMLAHVTSLRDLRTAVGEVDTAWRGMTPAPIKPRVLVTVSGGCADAVVEPGVDVEIFDWDNYNDDPDNYVALLPAHFADLAQPLGIPVENNDENQNQ